MLDLNDLNVFQMSYYQEIGCSESIFCHFCRIVELFCTLPKGPRAHHIMGVWEMHHRDGKLPLSASCLRSRLSPGNIGGPNVGELMAKLEGTSSQ